MFGIEVGVYVVALCRKLIVTLYVALSSSLSSLFVRSLMNLMPFSKQGL